MPGGTGHNGGFNPYRDANGRFSSGGSRGGSRPSIRPEGYTKGAAAPVERPGSAAAKKSYTEGRKRIGKDRYTYTIGAKCKKDAEARSLAKVSTVAGKKQVKALQAGKSEFERGMKMRDSGSPQYRGNHQNNTSDGLKLRVAPGSKGVNAAAKKEGQAHWKTKAAYFGKTTYASRDEHNGKTYAQIQKTHPQVIKSLAAKPGGQGQEARLFLQAQQNVSSGTTRPLSAAEQKRRYAVNTKYKTGKR